MDHGPYKVLNSHPSRNLPQNGEVPSCRDDTDGDQNTSASHDASDHVSGWYQAEDDEIRRWTPGWWLGMFFILLVGILRNVGNQIVSALLGGKAVTRDDCKGKKFVGSTWNAPSIQYRRVVFLPQRTVGGNAFHP